MEFVSGIVVYVIIWWVLIFVILPWGVTPQINPPPGCAVEAPENPRIGLKLAVTTVLAFALWLVAMWIISQRFITFDTFD